MIAEEIGERLKDRRKDLDLMQVDVVALTPGLLQSQLSAYERGVRVPRIPVLAAIAQTLGTSVSELLDGIC